MLTYNRFLALFHTFCRSCIRVYSFFVVNCRIFLTWSVRIYDISGTWVITLLPTLCLMSRKQPPLGNRDYIGWGMWLCGLLIEVIADYQKTVFKHNPANEVGTPYHFRPYFIN